MTATRIRFNLINGGHLDRDWRGDASDAAEHTHLVFESGNECFEVRHGNKLILIPIHSILTIEIDGDHGPTVRDDA